MKSQRDAPPSRRVRLCMDSPGPHNIDYAVRIKSWAARAPWYRRISAKTGLQGKLVLGFMFLLAVSMGSSLWLFLNESHEVLDRVMADESRTVSQALAMASESALARRDVPQLNRMGRELLRNRDLVAVAFYGPDGEMVALATQQPDLEAARTELLPNPRDQIGDLMVAHKRRSERLGNYTQVTTPVTTARHVTASGRPGGAKLVGYVTLCFSQSDDEQELARVGHLLVLIGGVAALVSLPLVYALVHRIFHPIRQLVTATEKIAAGDLGAEVAVNRPDVIGTLARSFNEMVKKVRSQQEELAQANQQLADANKRLADANILLFEANERLEQANWDMEKKVTQRTGQLEAANGRLRREIAEKEDFLRAVSHDLNAPLRNISGMAAMLLMKHRESFDADVINRLERIQKNVEVETDLIAELLELSRIKTRRLKLEPVDLEALITEIGGVFEHDLRGRGIRVLVDHPLPRLNCERARMRQVFQNLIDNAVKYMGDGCPGPAGNASSPNPEPSPRLKEIHIGCVVRADEAEFYVRDTGMGIDPDDLDKVFYVFRRGKGAAVQGVSGKGVGLASVKSIVETYNGSIWAESQLGRGSTFKFTVNGQFVLPPSSSAGVTSPTDERGRAA
jgi:signal transduction histidine kinase